MTVIYCFALSASNTDESCGLRIFININKDMERAIKIATRYNLSEFPVDKGWTDHAYRMVFVNEETIADLAEYNAQVVQGIEPFQFFMERWESEDEYKKAQ